MKTSLATLAFTLALAPGCASQDGAGPQPTPAPASSAAPAADPVAAPNPLGGIGTWTGTGTTYSPGGEAFGDFTIELTRAAVDAQTVQAHGTITLEDGSVMTFDQTFTSDGGSTFRIESPRGQGGGVCLGDGLCQSYEDDGGGAGYATTMIVDGPDRLRVLVTQLQDGRAVRLVRQTLTRKQ